VIVVSAPGLLARLRNPMPAEVVSVSLSGHPAAVAAIARALASVTVVSGMRHTATTDVTIRVGVTCHLPRRVREARR
jgi:hypothetical protein